MSSSERVCPNTECLKVNVIIVWGCRNALFLCLPSPFSLLLASSCAESNAPRPKTNITWSKRGWWHTETHKAHYIYPLKHFSIRKHISWLRHTLLVVLSYLFHDTFKFRQGRRVRVCCVRVCLCEQSLVQVCRALASNCNSLYKNNVVPSSFARCHRALVSLPSFLLRVWALYQL